MKKYLLVILLAISFNQVQAAPITFSNPQIRTAAIASVDDVEDAQFATSPPDALPLLTFAEVITGIEFAAASAVGDSAVGGSFLQTTSDVFAAGVSAFAFAAVNFVADFTGTGAPLRLLLDLDTLTDQEGDGFAESLIDVLLVSRGVTLLDEAVASSGVSRFAFELAAGAPATLSVLLTNSALANDGSGSAISSLEFRVNEVPEAPMLLLLLSSLALLIRARRNFF